MMEASRLEEEPARVESRTDTFGREFNKIESDFRPVETSRVFKRMTLADLDGPDQ